MLTRLTETDPAQVVGRVFAGVGLIFMIIIILLVLQDQKIARSSTKVTGTVTSLEYDNSGSAAPVIGYRFNGKKRYLHGSIWSSPPSFEEGEQVELLIIENDHEKAIINSFFERYFFISLLGLFAVVFGGIGVALLTLMKK